MTKDSLRLTLWTTWSLRSTIRGVRAVFPGIIISIAALSAWGQAPGLQWSVSAGARVFAVDDQTNVFANAGSNTLVLNGSGALVRSNSICPLPGIAARDALGNLYYTGSFELTQDFGGIVLVGGWFDPSPPYYYHPGYPSCYLAKYNSAGSLLWAVKFGVNRWVNLATDLQPDLNGGCFAGYNVSEKTGRLGHFSSSGGDDWEIDETELDPGNGIKLGGITSSNCCFFALRHTPEPGGRIDVTGNRNYFANSLYLTWPYPDGTNSKPTIDDLGQAYQVGTCQSPICSNAVQVLRKFALNGGILWDMPIGQEPQYLLGRDPQGNVYLAGASNLFAKYSSDGILIWSTNYGKKCSAMAVDSAGNRFLSFSDGTVARVDSDAPPLKPGILSGPQSQTVFLGDNVTFSVTVAGTQPLRYAWARDGSNLLGASSSSLTLNSVSLSQTGLYSVIITNTAGAITSAPAVLRIKQVELYAASLLLSNTTYTFTSPPTLSIHSAFTNGSAFYTTDGAPPSFSSTYYSGPFVLSNSATVRAIGYSADFSKSEEADTVDVIVLERHTLTASTSGGGSVTLNPPGGTYIRTNIVTVTAVPSTGWNFLYWQGDASGTNPTITISMERDKAVSAVFGTALSTTVTGNGHVDVYPQQSFYPYSSVARLTGVPDPGYYFGFWGNAATGNTNPLYFTVTTANPTVSSIFGALPAGQSALTVLINGDGRVNANPRANSYSTNQSVTLTAVPDSGRTFLDWSGDASGTQNPLTVQMSQSRVITANFSSGVSLQVNRNNLDGFSSAGFRFTLLSDPQTIWRILSSSNLNSWQVMGTVTNTTGQLQFTDATATNQAQRFYKAGPGP